MNWKQIKEIIDSYGLSDDEVIYYIEYTNLENHLKIVKEKDGKEEIISKSWENDI